MDDIRTRVHKRRVVMHARSVVPTVAVRTKANPAKLKKVAYSFGSKALSLSGVTKQSPIEKSYWKRLKHGIFAFVRDPTSPRRMMFASMALIMVTAIAIEVNKPKVILDRYSLNKVEDILLDEPNPAYAVKLKNDIQSGQIKYNEGYVPGAGTSGESSSPKMTADFGSIGQDNRVTVKDPVNNVGVTFKPKFKVEPPQKNENRVVYPIAGKNASKVYTMKASGIKEDIILFNYSKDELKFEYDIELSEGLEMRSEQDGSLAVYGPSEPLLGQVSTSSEKDQELLKKALNSSEKNKLLFRIPAPFVIEAQKDNSEAKAWYSLQDKQLTVHATNLKNADYPLSIDPSVYVDTASKLMRGNNETNLDFDVDNQLIQKGNLTGGRFDSWTNSLALPEARWNQATVATGGYVYVTGGKNGDITQSTVYWSKFNTTTKALESPNPGTGACSNWCTSTAYNLPAARAGHSMVAYNGYLYVLGGVDSAGVRSNTVYIAKLGANGEPSLWHPTDSNKTNWSYWYTSSITLTSERSYAAAAAFNNRIYLVGGQTTASPGGVTTVEYAELTPIGTYSSWSTTGMTALPSALNSHSLQIYNNRMYVIGGNSNAAMVDAVRYIKINNDGMLAGSWVSTNSFLSGRMAWGGNFSTIWGGYIYLSGGCTTINASGYCTAIAGDTQLASINADGSVTKWTTVTGVTNTRMGYGLVGWRNTLYSIGGCTAQDTTSGACTTTEATAQYGNINQDGDASTTADSTASGVGTCTGTDPYNCDMPPVGNGAGTGGRMSGGTVVNNGFIYYIGGCTEAGADSVCFTGNSGKASDTISYAQITADGSLRRVTAAACTDIGNTYYGSWCVDNTRTINGSAGLAGFGYTVFNNVIYVIGGTNGTQWQSSVWRNTLNANGSLGTWASQTFANLDLGPAKGYQYVFSRANPASASTYPGNLYVLGGCSGVTATDNGLNCQGAMYTQVYKCNIMTTGALEEVDASDCTTTGQLQIDSEPGTAGAQGLGVMAGTVYANHVYLIGGQSPNELERGAIMYAKIDNNNNIVATSGSIWITSPYIINPVRERGVAFGYNGYLYGLAGYNNGSSLSDLMFSKIDVSNGSISNFKVSQVTVNPRWDARAIVSNGFVYAFGGCSAGAPPSTCTALTGSVQAFQVYNNFSGGPADYTASSNLFATDRLGASSTVLNGYIYVAGGCTSSSDCSASTNTVQYAALNPDGSVGTWNATTGSMPAARAFGQLESVGGSLYYIGGQLAASTSESKSVYYATPSGGNISTWTLATDVLPTDRTQHSAAVWNDRIYVTGGIDAAAANTSTVYISPPLSSGGNITTPWTTSTSFNVPRSGHVTVAYANNLYVFGGYTGSQYLNDAQYAKINADGTLGTWSYTTSLPTRLRQADGFAANGFMYILGGRSADTACASNTLVAPISANTTIASGNNPTGIGDWFETNEKYAGDRYGAAVSYNEGKAYVLGGACGSTLAYTGTNRVVSTTVQSQPQIAKYSRMIDTDTDVFPTKWLMNGLDNDIGARWLMRYRSSTNGTAAWGQETNFGRVRLGQPENYIPLNSTGANTNFARYYYLTMNIDSSQAFGYPEDVSRGPTIADLTLFFTSDPSKRMRHGKTFTGGEQQPLDTPF